MDGDQEIAFLKIHAIILFINNIIVGKLSGRPDHRSRVVTSRLQFVPRIF